MAQIISLDKLEELAKKPIAEVEKSSEFYQEFSDLFRNQIEKQIRKHKFTKFFQSKSSIMNAAIQRAYIKTRDGFLQDNCPPVEYIAEGSARAAYALDGGQCLKIALDEKGIGQNKAEVKNMKSSDSLDIFPKLYDYADDYTSILVECIAPCSNVSRDIRKFTEAIGLKSFKGYYSPTDAIASVVHNAVYGLPRSFETIFQTILGKAKDNVVKDLCKIVLHPNGVGQRILSSFCRWAIENNEHFDIRDAASIKNWGFAVRSGKVVPIVLDAGFSPEVRDTWYS